MFKLLEERRVVREQRCEIVRRQVRPKQQRLLADGSRCIGEHSSNPRRLGDGKPAHQSVRTCARSFSREGSIQLAPVERAGAVQPDGSVERLPANDIVVVNFQPALDDRASLRWHARLDLRHECSASIRNIVEAFEHDVSYGTRPASAKRTII